MWILIFFYTLRTEFEKKDSTMIIDKSLVGKTVVLLIVQNSFTRRLSETREPFEAEILAVSGNFVTYQKKGESYSEKSKFVNANADTPVPTILHRAELYKIIVFASWDDCKAHQIALLTKSKLSAALSYRGQNITNEQFVKIAELLGWDDVLGQ